MGSPTAEPAVSIPRQHEPEAEDSMVDSTVPSESSENSWSYIDDMVAGLGDQPDRQSSLQPPRDPNPFEPASHPFGVPSSFSPALDPSNKANPFASDYTPVLSNLIADLSVVEAGVTTEYITRWQETVKTDQTHLEISTIQTAYCSCMGPFYALLPLWNASTDCDDEVKLALNRNFLLLREWGMSYSVLEGQLDLLPEDEVVETIVSFLLEISAILQRRSPTPARPYSRNSHHEVQSEETAASLHNISKTASGSAPAAEIDDRDDADDPAEETLSQWVTELGEYVQLLNELHPSIESWPGVTLHEYQPSPPAEDGFRESASLFYSDMVRSKFKRAPSSLVDALGDLNLERFLRLADARNGVVEEPSESPETASVVPKSASFQDSGLGSSLPRTQSFARALSRASSSAFTLAGESRARLPQLPLTAKAGLFSCDFCGIAVSYRTTKDYRKHLLQDLQPYSCLEIDCSENDEAFSSRQDWVRHLQMVHHLSSTSPPRKCQLCEEMTGEGMVEICRHYADHLEDIAIAASPLDIDSDEGSDTDSEKSHGYKQEEDGKLATINEDTEEATEGLTDPSLHIAPEERVEHEAVELETDEADVEASLHTDTAETKEDTNPTPYPGEDGSVYLPVCAICNNPQSNSDPECPCESERLKIAVHQAETRAMGERFAEIRDWVINHSRIHILNGFEDLIRVRKKSHSAYLATLAADRKTERKMEAEAELKRGIDADWRASILRYPEVLDYFYSLVDVRLPDDRSRQVARPPFAQVVRTPFAMSGERDPSTRQDLDSTENEKQVRFEVGRADARAQERAERAFAEKERVRAAQREENRQLRDQERRKLEGKTS